MKKIIIAIIFIIAANGLKAQHVTATLWKIRQPGGVSDSIYIRNMAGGLDSVFRMVNGTLVFDNKVMPSEALVFSLENNAQKLYEVAGTTQQAVIARSAIYIPHNASLTTITLPTSAVVGDLIQIVGEGAGKFKIAQNASQYIIGVGGVTTTPGTGGSLTAADANCTISLRCTATNKFTITSQQGTFTPL